MKLLRKRLALLLVFVLYASARLFVPYRVFAQASDVASITDFETMFENTVKAAAGLTGVVLFVMLLIGGFKFLFAAGDMKKLEAAKGTLTSAIIGLVVVSVAYLILLAIKTITGVDVTQFKINISSSP